jgi:amino acid adenylation domain-containing protein
MTQIVEQITQKQGKIQEQQVNSQRQSLEDITAPLRLPFNRVRSEVPQFLKGVQPFSLQEGLIVGLRRVSLSAHVSLNTLLFAAFQTLLYRYTLRKNFICGFEGKLPFQEDDAHASMPIAIQTDLAGEMRVDDLLQLVQTQVTSLPMLNQPPADVSFTSLKNDPPTFQVMFRTALQDAEATSRQFPELALNCDIMLEIYEKENSICGSLKYNANLFDHATISRIAEHYQNLLEGMQQDSTLQLCDLPLLTAQESKHLLLDWNNTATSLEESIPVHQKFAQWARHTPDALAVTSEAQSICYHDLNLQANQLAHYLQGLGVALETPVVLCMPRSIEFVIGMLGILKAGGMYIPVDPSTPPERLSFLLQDTHVPIAVTTRKLASAFSDYTGQLVFLPGEAYIQENDDDPVNNINDRNGAYIIYTSGSTGKPKGVLVEHKGLSNLLLWHQHTFAITSNERASQVAGINFDATGWEIWPYLTAGASVHFIDEETRITPRKLQDWLISHQITIGFLPTPLMESVQNLAWPAASPLRTLLTGGDKLHRSPSSALSFEVVNNYGPTENTVVSTSGVLPKDEATEEAPSIGTPIDNTSAYILDPWLNPVPVGVAGELYVGGIGLARGYINRPDLTAERFLPDPLGKRPGARLYRTGDLVRYRPDGTIEFLERIDSQVKIRGFRIELGEIETSLSTHPAVGDVIVLAREDDADEKMLVAYLVPAQSSSVSVHELRSYLQQRLPHYMIPSDFVWMEQFPLTLNGKVDRRRLPTPSHGQPEEQVIAPRTAVERSLAKIWQDVMHSGPLSINANFFELGGYSLQATQIIARIRHALAVEVPLHYFFQTPTVAALAEYIEQQSASSQDALSIPTRSIQEHTPISFAQERLWFLHQLAPQSAFYNIPVALHICGPLQIAALERSLNTIVERHEVLRTTFLTVAGEPVQTIATHLPIAIHQLAVTAYRTDERMSQAMRLVTEQAQLPFDLAQGPLLRVTLVPIDEQEYILLVSMHHSITDGWSVGVFFRELEACYQAFVMEKQPELPQLMIQYADFACWQRQWLQGETLEGMLQYWKQQLQDAPSLTTLPLKTQRSGIQTFQGATLSLLLPKSLIQALVAVSNREKATLFMGLLAAFKMLLFSYTGQADLLIGTPVANRTSVELEQLIGFFVNMLVLRTNLEGDPTYQQILQRVRPVALEAYAHQDLPFEFLVEALHIQRDIDRNPLFQIVFALQDAPDAVPSIEGITIEPLAIQLETALFDLTVEVKEAAEEFVVSANYSTDLFEDATIQKLLHDYKQILHLVSSNPHTRLSELSPSIALATPPTFRDVSISSTYSEKRNVQIRVPNAEEKAEPLTPLQELLVDIWSQVLKRTNIGIWDNFFEVGGHSLLATQVISRIHDTFQIDLPVRIIFQSPTVAALVEELVRYETFPGQFSLTAEIYKQVNDLSDDEAYAVLQQKKNEDG